MTKLKFTRSNLTVSDCWSWGPLGVEKFLLVLRQALMISLKWSR